MTNNFISDVFDGNMCENMFEKNPETKCVLYENERCNGAEGLKEFHDGERLSNVKNQTLFDVESIFVRKGCRFTIQVIVPYSAVYFDVMITFNVHI